MSEVGVQRANEAAAILCSPCSRDEVEEIATQFCFSCQEYMCDICSKYHKRNKASAKHTVTDVKDIPLHQLQTTSVSSDELDVTETCEKHNYKKLKYICVTHTELCCSRCVIENHKACNNTLHFSEYKMHDDYNRQLKINNETLVAMEENAQKLVHYETQHTKLVRVMENRETNKGNTIRDKLITQIQQVFSDRSKAIKREADSIVNTSEQLQTDTRETISEVRRCQNLLEHVANSENDAKKVIAVMSVASCTENIRRDVIQQFKNISKTTIVADLQVDELKRAISDLGNVYPTKLTQDIPKFVDIPVPISKSYLPVLASSINVTAKDALSQPCIRECCLLDMGIVVASDESNKAIKLFDTINAREMSCVQCDSEPWGVAKVDNNTVAVTFPLKKKIMLYKYKDGKITNESTIETESDCWGIAVCRKNFKLTLAVYSKSNISLLCISMDSKEKETIDVKIPSRVTLSHINHIAADSAVGQIYLSCSKEHSLFACDFEGNVKWQVSHSIHTPMGLCVAADGFINICSFGTHEILRVNSKGDKMNKVVSHAQLNGPVAIACGKDKDTVVVCDHDPGNVQIKVFHFEQ